MRKIYLVRHGTPEQGKEEKRYIGVTDVPLGSRGFWEAERLGDFFREKKRRFHIYSSPLERSRATAEILAGRLAGGTGAQEKIQILEDLREIHLGDWENLPVSEVKRRFPAAFAARGLHPGTYRTPNGESFVQCGVRFHEAVDRIRDHENVRIREQEKHDGTEKDRDLILVAHAGVIRAYLAALLKLDADQVLDLSIPYASVTELEDAPCSFAPAPVRIGVRPLALLDEEELLRLYEKYQAPEHIRRHMKKVAEIAADLLDRMGERPEAMLLDKERIRKACLLHDLLRMETHHAEAAAAALVKEGYPELAALVGSHHLADDTDDENGPLTEEELLFYADKLAKEDRRVSVEERFADRRRKYPAASALEYQDRMYRKTVKIEKKIQQLFIGGDQCGDVQENGRTSSP